MKWLAFLAGAAIFYYWLKRKKQTAHRAEQASKNKPVRAKLDQPEDIVQCQCCRLYLPRPEAIAKEDRFYCSNEHLKRFDQEGWLGTAQWHRSPNYDQRPAGIVPDLAVIHHISLPPGEFQGQKSTQFIVDFFQNTLDSTAHPYFREISGQAVSSHFLISRQGELIQLVSAQQKAWHAGVSSFLGRDKCNDFSIGIELEGDGDHPFEVEQYQTLSHLSNILTAAYPNIRFAGHSDIAPGRKTDPGLHFDWGKFQMESQISPEKFPYGLTLR
jgi:AmpD protein